MKPIRLLSGFLTVGGWTLWSRVLGFAREVMLLSLIGPGPVMDAFVAAFRLPNMLRRFFAEGAFNAAFVPMFSKKLEAGSGAEDFAQDALGALGLAVLAITGLAMIFMPGLVWLTASGFYGDARFDLAVGFGRIVFPYIVFMALGALFSGVLNATGRFAVAAGAPSLLNVCVIAAMALAWMQGREVVVWLIWAVPIAGVAQVALTWWSARAAGFRLGLAWPRWTPDIRRMLLIAGPVALTSGVMQVNLVVGQIVASRFEGAVSWLFAADRLYQLPLGVVGIAVGIVLLPDLSRKLQARDAAGGRAALSRAAEFALCLTVPAAVALCVIPLPLVSVLFGRGETGADDVAAIAMATAVYGLGLPAFVLQKVQQPLYFARADTSRPFRYALAVMVLNAALAFGLAPALGWIAPAIGTTVSGWVMVGLLWWGARPMGDVARFDGRLRARVPRIAVASALMGVALWLAQLALSGALYVPGLRYLALIGLIATGILSFAVAAQVTGALHLSELRGKMRRG